ncbi:O-antigen ligase family protein [Desemzia sp. C1]|uniref:O-antigen ligase family protein n=1 Tax=Desemzia sp. C1 TaxID=2892016 RepID=UPI001E2FB651|nr:O-antigen ligase family protein [Desemzia sp. C1]MCI3030017.1 O-antigen ligase family protein [Desemzia sp. C1]MCI3030022.1 O-antigen ligase family protein [Desemzia sp. C1]
MMVSRPIELGKSTKSSTGSSVLIVMTCFIGALLNQSDVLFGMNISLADFFIVLFIGALINYNLFHVSSTHILVFLLFSVVIFINAVFVIPNLYQIPVYAGAVLTDYIKVVVSFLYFLVGYLIAKNGLSQKLFKWFAIAAVILGCLGIIFSLVPIPQMVDLLFYEQVRLKGLMNDPNYFSVIQCAAIAILLRYKPLPSLFKIGSISILILSIFSSGSKTGFLTLGCLLVFWMFNTFLEGKIEVRKLIFNLICLFVVFFFLPNIQAILSSSLEMISDKFPVFSRVELLLTDFDQAVTANGSGREEQWVIAMDLIQEFPLLGVGNTANYLTVVQGMSPMGNLAHNTYLQMAGEWGIPITLFMMYYITRVFFISVSKGKNKQVHLTTKEMLVAFLVSSLSLSFNNSRIFWLLLGMAVWYSVELKEKNHTTKTDR